MRIKGKRREFNSLLFILVILFTIGVILGSTAFFCIDKGILADVRIDIGSVKIESDFIKMFKESLVIEIAWVGLAWIIAQIGFLSPFSCTVLALRGFVTGFTVSFIILEGSNIFKILLRTIVPQCLLGMPFLTFVIFAGVNCNLHNKGGQYSEWESLGICILSFIGAVAVAFLETLLARFL